MKINMGRLLGLVAILSGLIILFIFLFRPDEPQEQNRLSVYHISAILDTTDYSLSCLMQLEWHNTSDSTISEIPFNFKLDSAQTLIKSISSRGRTQDFRYSSKETHGFEGFVIRLSEPVGSREKIDLNIAFKTSANDLFRERMLFYSEDLPNVQHFENGKFRPYYQVHSDYKVEVTIPKEFNLACTGKIKKADILNKQQKIATEINSVPSYGFILIRDVILKEGYSSSGILIRSFYFENDKEWGEKLLDYSKRIVDFYVDTLGFYPQPVLTIIPGYPKPYGGWPVCPNVVGIHRGINEMKEEAETHGHWIMSHEIGHQYWGYNYVLEPTDYPQWFGIGMGIHTDRLYALKNIPDFDHNESFSNSYLRAMSKGYNTTIMQTVDTLNKQGFDWNNSLKHDKSFFVLQMLAHEIGEEVFFEIFKYCLNSYKGINVTLEMFQKDCETISGKNLEDFFQTWFYSNRYLEYQIDTVLTNLKGNIYENKIIVEKLGSADISFLELAVIDEGGERKRFKINGSEKIQEISVNTNSPVEKVIIDPDKKLLLINRNEWDKDE